MKKIGLFLIIVINLFCFPSKTLSQRLNGPDIPIVAGDRFNTYLVCLCGLGEEYGIYEWNRTVFQPLNYDCHSGGIFEIGTFRVIKYGNYTSTINVRVFNDNGKEIDHGSCSITVIEPSATNLSISTNGTLETYSNISFSLNYNHNLSATSIIKRTVTWTINNAGSTQTYTGNSTGGISLKNPGLTTITATLKLSDSANGYNKEFTTTKTVNVAVGYSNPVITGISGPEKLDQGRNANYQAIPLMTNVPYLKYVWEVNYDEIGASNTPTLSYTFNDPGLIYIYCTVTNINNGRSSSASKVVEVVDLRRSQNAVANEQFFILNMPGTLIVTKPESNESFSLFKETQRIDYQLNELLTGTTALSGKIEAGVGIDTGNLRKGIYVMTLKSHDHIETHKVVIE